MLQFLFPTPPISARPLFYDFKAFSHCETKQKLMQMQDAIAVNESENHKLSYLLKKTLVMKSSTVPVLLRKLWVLG